MVEPHPDDRYELGPRQRGRGGGPHIPLHPCAQWRRAGARETSGRRSGLLNLFGGDRDWGGEGCGNTAPPPPPNRVWAGTARHMGSGAAERGHSLRGGGRRNLVMVWRGARRGADPAHTARRVGAAYGRRAHAAARPSTGVRDLPPQRTRPPSPIDSRPPARLTAAAAVTSAAPPPRGRRGLCGTPRRPRRRRRHTCGHAPEFLVRARRRRAAARPPASGARASTALSSPKTRYTCSLLPSSGPRRTYLTLGGRGGPLVRRH